MTKEISLKHFNVKAARYETPQGSLTLWAIFLPFFIELLLTNSMGTVNTLTLSHYSDDAVAAVGAANQLMGMLFTFYTVISGGASIVMNHRLGRKDQKGAAEAAFASLFFIFFLSLILGIVVAIYATPLMKAMNLEGQVLDQAAHYLRICVIFSFLQALISAISAIFRSHGLPKTAVWVSLFMNAINALLNILVIFRPIDIPLYGVSGIAAANVISRVLALLCFVLLLLFGPLKLNLPGMSLKSLKSIRQILAIGVPGGISSLSYSTSQVVSTSILAVLGTAAITTKIYLSTIFFYVYVVGLALGLATSQITGWLTGAGEYEKARKLNQKNLKITVGLNIFLSTCIFLFGNPLMKLFTDNPQIIAMAAPIMFIDIFVEIGRAFNHIENNSLQGAGDVLVPMVISVTSCWAVSILFSYLLGIQLGLGLVGCWIAFMMDELFRGIIFFFRFRSGKWIRKNI